MTTLARTVRSIRMALSNSRWEKRQRSNVAIMVHYLREQATQGGAR